MERVLKNGVLRLPPGFRFHPTDEELVVQYLQRKAMSYPLPASIIPEFEVCRSDPWDLPGDMEQERYFFNTREAKYPNGSRSNRATGSGYWKTTGLDKQIVGSRTNHVVGMKKTLVFYRGKPPKGCKTDWIMHEYRLQNGGEQAPAAADENWVLCRIFLKKRGSKNGVNQDTAAPVFYDFMARERALHLQANSFSGSSGVTEISLKSDAPDHEEESSSSSSSFITSYRSKNTNSSTS